MLCDRIWEVACGSLSSCHAVDCMAIVSLLWWMMDPVKTEWWRQMTDCDGVNVTFPQWEGSIAWFRRSERWDSLQASRQLKALTVGKGTYSVWADRAGELREGGWGGGCWMLVGKTRTWKWFPESQTTLQSCLNHSKTERERGRKLQLWQQEIILMDVWWKTSTLLWTAGV